MINQMNWNIIPIQPHTQPWILKPLLIQIFLYFFLIEHFSSIIFENKFSSQSSLNKRLDDLDLNIDAGCKE